jgi:hypothetical protein
MPPVSAFSSGSGSGLPATSTPYSKIAAAPSTSLKSTNNPHSLFLLPRRPGTMMMYSSPPARISAFTRDSVSRTSS